MLTVGDGRTVQSAVKVEIKGPQSGLKVYVDGKLLDHAVNCTIEVTSPQGFVFVNGVRYEKVTISYQGDYAFGHEHNYGVAYILTKLPAIISESP